MSNYMSLEGLKQQIAERMVRREVYYCASSFVSGLRGAVFDGAGQHWDVTEEEVMELCEQRDYEGPLTYEGWEIFEDEEGYFQFKKEIDENRAEAFNSAVEAENDDSHICFAGYEHSEGVFESYAECYLSATEYRDQECDTEDYIWDIKVSLYGLSGWTWTLTQTHERTNETWDEEAEAYEQMCYRENIEPDYHEVYEHWIVSDWLARKLKQRGYITGELCGFTLWGRQCTGQAIYLDHGIQEIAIEYCATDEERAQVETMKKAWENEWAKRQKQQQHFARKAS